MHWLYTSLRAITYLYVNAHCNLTEDYEGSLVPPFDVTDVEDTATGAYVNH